MSPKYIDGIAYTLWNDYRIAAAFIAAFNCHPFYHRQSIHRGSLRPSYSFLHVWVIREERWVVAAGSGREKNRDRVTQREKYRERDELPQFRAARGATSNALVSAAIVITVQYKELHRASSRALRLIAFQVSPAPSIKHDVWTISRFVHQRIGGRAWW